MDKEVSLLSHNYNIWVNLDQRRRQADAVKWLSNVTADFFQKNVIKEYEKENSQLIGLIDVLSTDHPKFIGKSVRPSNE